MTIIDDERMIEILEAFQKDPRQSIASRMTRVALQEDMRIRREQNESEAVSA
ncbi:hypothetical protein [Paracoccus sp. ME4]|uniref:hypothetical protein n=1 Tax=Paracoccus sp. ME4 TaxID=3138066 RepID=UPI00398BA84C